MCNKKKFPCTYKSITDINPNPDYEIREFCQDQFVEVKSSTYFLNFKTKINLKDI